MTIVKGTREFDKAPTVNGADVLDANSVLDDLNNVSVAAPSTGDRLEWNGSAWVAVAGAQQDSASDIASATNQITTTSSSYVLAASMTLTPASGTYLVWFSGVCKNTTSLARMSTAIYSGGSVVSASQRDWTLRPDDNDPPYYLPFGTTAKVTVNGSEAIEGRFSENGVGTAYMRERQLMILKVA